MTNKLKCPICQNNLHKINMVVSTCTNDKCKLWGSSIPNLVLKALTQAKQDLEIARKALKNMSLGNVPSLPDDETLANAMCNYARDALKQIEHKEI